MPKKPDADAQPTRRRRPDARIAVRRAAALQLRLQGGTYRQIADQLKQQPHVSGKYDFTQAWKDVQDELERLDAENGERAERLRRLTYEQLNALLAKYWPLAQRGDYAALDRVLAILDRIGRLYGVDKLIPTPVALGGEVALSGNLAVESSTSQVVFYIPDNGRDHKPAPD